MRPPSPDPDVPTLEGSAGSSRIEGPLTVAFLHRQKWRFVLVGELEFRVGAPKSPKVLRILPGSTTDFASVPSPIRWLIPNWSRGHALTATIHDALYRGTHFSYTLEKKGEPPVTLPRPTKREADDIYREANDVVASFGGGLKRWQRMLAYWGVRIFGKSAYKG